MANSFPDVIVQLPERLDITQSDSTKVQQYQAAIESGDYEEAQSVLESIPNYTQKIITADFLNELLTLLVDMQIYYRDNITTHIEDKQTVWENEVDTFNLIGVYSPTTTYVKNNMVTYNNNDINSLYLAKIDLPNTNIPPTNTSYWQKITVQGIKGDAGEGLNFNGDWDIAQTYSVNNIVTYGNKIWRAIDGGGTNIGQEPLETSDYWEMIGDITPKEISIAAEQPTFLEDGEIWLELQE